jgi:hypothetical protein
MNSAQGMSHRGHLYPGVSPQRGQKLVYLIIIGVGFYFLAPTLMTMAATS